MYSPPPRPPPTLIDGLRPPVISLCHHSSEMADIVVTNDKCSKPSWQRYTATVKALLAGIIGGLSAIRLTLMLPADLDPETVIQWIVLLFTISLQGNMFALEKNDVFNLHIRVLHCIIKNKNVIHTIHFF